MSSYLIKIQFETKSFQEEKIELETKYYSLESTFCSKDVKEVTENCMRYFNKIAEKFDIKDFSWDVILEETGEILWEV